MRTRKVQAGQCADKCSHFCALEDAVTKFIEGHTKKPNLAPAVALANQFFDQLALMVNLKHDPTTPVEVTPEPEPEPAPVEVSVDEEAGL